VAKIEESVMIDRPVEDVWKFVTDLSKLPKWITEVLELRQTSTGPLGVGATCEFREKMRNTTMTISSRVTEYELNRRLSFEHISGPAKGSIITFSMDTIGGKTKFTNTNDMKFSGFYKLFGSFFTPTLRRAVVTSLGNLKHILESEEQS
jgi:uncharacterized protein YndB with AHSA1/START domain